MGSHVPGCWLTPTHRDGITGPLPPRLTGLDQRLGKLAKEANFQPCSCHPQCSFEQSTGIFWDSIFPHEERMVGSNGSLPAQRFHKEIPFKNRPYLVTKNGLKKLEAWLGFSCFIVFSEIQLLCQIFWQSAATEGISDGQGRVWRRNFQLGFILKHLQISWSVTSVLTKFVF